MSSEALLDELLGTLDVSAEPGALSLHDFLHGWTQLDQNPDYIDSYIEKCDDLLLFKHGQAASLLALFKRLNEKREDDTEDAPLTRFVAKFVCKLLELSPLNKLRVFSPDLVGYLLSQATTPTANELFLSLVELGISYDQLAHLYKLSLTNQKSLELLHHCFTRYSQQFKSVILSKESSILFDNVYLYDYRKGFTIGTWIKLNSGLHNLTKPIGRFQLIQLSAKDLDLPEDKKTIITYSLDGGRLIAQVAGQEVKFESFTFEIGRLYHVALIHNCESRKNSTIDLNVDGEFIESRSITPIFAEVNAKKESATKFAIGKRLPRQVCTQVLLTGSPESCNVMPEVTSLSIISWPQPREWILLAKGLGTNYAGTFQDANIVSLLDQKYRMLMRLKLQENNPGSADSGTGWFDRAYISPEHMALNFHCLNSQIPSADFVQINIQVSTWPQEHPKPKPVIIAQRPDTTALYWNPHFLLNRLFSIGGFGVVLKIAAESPTTEYLVRSLRILFHVLDRSPRSMAEFGSLSGYNILATLLKTKKQLMDMDVLICILKFIGYNEESPADSIIANGLAYRSLIADFEIWQPSREADGSLEPNSKETFKFVLYQLSVFGQDSKYHSQNLKKLGEMKIIKRIIQALKYRLVDEGLLPILHDSLLILLRQTPLPDLIRSMSLYVVYALNQKVDNKPSPLDKKCGICILGIIVTMICDESDQLNPEVFKRMLKSINAKWIMVLLGYDDINVIRMALRLAVKVMGLSSSRTRGAFKENGGNDMVRKLVSKVWYDNSIYVMLFCGVFGLQYSSAKKSVDILSFVQSQVSKLSSMPVLMPELLPIINGIVETAAIKVRDLTAKGKYSPDDAEAANAINLLSANAGVWDECFNSIASLNKSYEADPTWIEEALLIELTVQMGVEQCPDAAEIQSVLRLYDQFIGSIFLGKLFSMSATSRDRSYVERVSNNYQTLFALTVMPLIFRHIRDFSETDMYLNYPQICATLLNIITQYFQCNSYYEFSDDDWKDNLNTTSLILTKVDKRGYEARTSSAFKNCRAEFSHSFIIRLCLATEGEIKDPEGGKESVKMCCDFFEKNESLILSGLDDKGKVKLICTFYKNLFDSEDLASRAAKCICLIAKSPDVSRRIALSFSHDIRLRRDFAKTLEKCSTLSPDEMKSTFYSDPQLKDHMNNIFNDTLNHLKQVLSLTPKLKYAKSVTDKYQARINCPTPKKWDLASMTMSIVESETRKFNRHIQDDKDDLAYYIMMYDKIRCRIPVDDVQFTPYLDTSEGRYRERKKIVREPNLEPLSFVDSDVFSAKSTHSVGSDGLDGNGYEFVSDQVDLDATQEDKNRKIIRSLYVHDKIVQISNVTQIIGLETYESIIIFGLTHLYLMSNYFHTSDYDIVDIDEAPKAERDPYVRALSANKNTKIHKTKSWPLTDMVSVSKRKFLLRDVAAEIFFIDGSSVLITCTDSSARNALLNQLSSKITAKYNDNDLEEAMKLASRQKIIYSASSTSLAQQETFKFTAMLTNLVESVPGINTAYSSITRKWLKGELSNFYYLMLINTIAGRTFNDLTQYPVFPFVLSDYESEELDLSDPKVFRDLSKPMGAQTEKREKQFQERYQASKEMAPDVPPAHYGTHYSSAMVVSSYLIRLEPFVKSYLILQGGKFDHADRLFSSIAKTWKSASQDNTSDVRELIPEFYYLPEFLVNTNHFDFGTLQDGTSVNDVDLPPWAKGDPRIFVQKMMMALESDYVSEHLPEWIDLIFGFKQDGDEAVQACNVFHHLSYPGAIDLDSVQDERERDVIISTIHNFGQTPLKIFNKPHPKRLQKVTKFVFDPSKFLGVPIVSKGVLNDAVDMIYYDHTRHQWRPVPSTVRRNGVISIRRYSASNLIINESLMFEQLGQNRITRFEIISPTNMFIVGFQDGSLIIYKLTADALSNITNSQRSSVQYTRSYPSAANPNELMLQNLAVMRAHRSAIRQIKFSAYNDLLLTMDESGETILWDMVSHEKLKVVGTNQRLIAISQEHGFIATVDSENWLRMHTTNGELAYKIALKPGSSVIEFAKFNLAYAPKVDNTPWQHLSVIVVGYEDGTVEIYEPKLEYGWALRKMSDYKVIGKVTALTLKLNIKLDGEGNKVGRGELFVGTDKGQLMVWS